MQDVTGVKIVLLAQSPSQWDVVIKIVQYHAAAIAMLGLAVAALIYAIWRPHGVPRVLVGPQRWPAVPWMLPEILLAAGILIVGVDVLAENTVPRRQLPASAYEGVNLASTYALLVGPYDGGLASGLASFVSAFAAYPDEIVRQIQSVQARMVAHVIIVPFLIYGVVVMMRRLVNAQTYQLGLHTNHWRQNLTLGCVGWAMITPLVIFIFIVVQLEFWETLWGRPTDHPVSRLLTLSQSPWTWVLATVMTVVIAPLKEEILLRGIIQPYLVRWPIASDIFVLFCVGWAITSLFSPGPALTHGNGLGPFLFVVFVAAGYSYGEMWMERWLPEPGVYRGIFATSLFFAAIHAGAWPSPIPIFVLSMILGVLAYRTGSLVGPITLHALFNATGMIVKYLESSAKW